MEAADAASILSMCAAYDNRTVTASAAAAWSAALDPTVTTPDARKIVIDHYAKTREWIMPSDINDANKALRDQRHLTASRNGADLVSPPESIDPDDVQRQLAWSRAYKTAIGDGHDVTNADTIACEKVGAPRLAIDGTKPVAQLVQQVADSMPRIPRRNVA